MPLTSVKSVSAVLVEQFTSALKQNPDILKDKKNLYDFKYQSWNKYN
jgi:hypothetical protein